MEHIFLTVLGMSLTASVVILVVLLVRLALRKAPRVFSYALWAVVLFRLLCPLTIESAFSLLPAARVVPVAGRGESTAQVLQIQTKIDAVDRPVNDFFVEHAYQGQPARPESTVTVPAPPVNQLGPEPDWRTVPAAVWLTGTALLLGYSALSLLRLRRRLVGSVPLEGEKNVRLADHIPSPFVLGLVFPKIYLPSDLPESERDYVLLHERTHLRRFDHVTRALAWVALSVHWFNPMVWLAFHLAGKDMEMSCDEAVLRKMGRDVRADYSTSLLRLSVGGKLPAGPLAFGGGDPQSRIKNVLSYRKPALWVVVLALAAVLCAGVALATDQSDLLIDPDSVTTVSHSARTFLNTEYVSHTARRDDLFDPDSPYARVLPEEDGKELVRLINTYHKTVYRQGDPKGDGLDDWALIGCQDGGYYLVHYYYWSSFCLNPFHPGHGEDDFVTLVTYYDASGETGTTWRMECDFDNAYQDWRNGVRPNDTLDSVPADLKLSIDQLEDSVPFVRIGGTIYGITLEHTSWNPPEWFAQFGPDSAALAPLGKLGFELPLCDNEVVCGLDAVWTDESRTAVKVTATPRAMISSYSAAGNLIFTVDLSKNGGTLLELEGHVPKLSPNAPELVPSEAEAVKVGRIAAKLLTAAEDFYANARSASVIGFTPVYTMYEPGRIRVEGNGLGRRAYVEWSPNGGLYFSGDPGGLCPALAGRSVEGGASWTEKGKTALEVLFNVNDERVASGTVNGFRIQFTMDLNSGAVTQKDFQSLVEGETLELTDQEMADMARILAELMRGAEDYYKSDPPLAPADPLVPAVLGVSYSLNELGNGVVVGGLDCSAAVWYPSLHGGTISPRLGLPEDGELGYLAMESPRFLGGYFADADSYANAFVLYYPKEPSPLLFVGVDEYTGSSAYDLGHINFTVDLASGEVKHREISGYQDQAPEFSDSELVTMARMLAGIVEGAADSWETLSNPPAEEGPLPFDQPLRLWFGSGAGAWRTIITLHPDGSFEGRYNDADMGDVGEDYPMGTEAVCIFHGRFGDIQQASAASWSMTLEELTLDTGHPLGEKWVEERTRYVSAQPYGFDCEAGGSHPGISFMLYTPEAKGYAPDDELYGMSGDNESTVFIKRELWNWWPDRHAWTPDSTLGCYALCNMETGYGFFDLSAWGLAPEQPRDY